MAANNNQPSKLAIAYGELKTFVVAVATELTYWLMFFAALAFAFLFLATVLAKFGFASRLVPPMSELWLLYIAGAFWLFRGGKL